MAEEFQMSDPTSVTVARPAGAGRLGVASGLFTIVGAGAAVASYGLASSIFRPHLGVFNVSAKELVTLAGAFSLTFGCFRTSRLLDQRRREGLASAMIMLAAPIAGYFAVPQVGLPVLVCSAAGIAILASVWRYLD